MPRTLLVLCLWAAIYLPALGTLEIKGEEGRRILPAITMLETGNYLVPYVGSDPYYTKPPLINWLVAASFKLFDARNEWTARLPSALSVLLVALAFLLLARRSLGEDGSFIAALIWLTNFGLVEKGRLIEIEAVYVSLAGLAFVSWLSWWKTERSPWLTWTVPWIFLGLALLAKGPLHLFFFYTVVMALCWGRWRSFFHPAHGLGLLLMLGIFAAWAVPALRAMPAAEVAQTWGDQIGGRLTTEYFEFSAWIMNVPRGLAYFLPWLLLFPLLKELNAQRRLAAAVAASFLVVCLLPAALPRYTMPLLAPATWLLASLLAHGNIAWPKRFRLAHPAPLAPAVRFPFYLALAVAGAMLVYALALTPFLRHREKVRNIARQINEAVPPQTTLHVVDPDYQPALFYLKMPLIYLPSVEQLPPDARFFLTQPDDAAAADARGDLIFRLRDYRKKEVLLYRSREADPSR